VPVVNSIPDSVLGVLLVLYGGHLRIVSYLAGQPKEPFMEPKDKEQPYPIIHHEECKGCGRCIAACPKQVLKLSDSLNERGYRYAEYSGEGCVGCANCFYACPEFNTFEIMIPERKPVEKKKKGDGDGDASK
jgi:2-oxoisovalerate ferredoxin oxidoreductase delta subunit